MSLAAVQPSRAAWRPGASRAAAVLTSLVVAAALHACTPAPGASQAASPGPDPSLPAVRVRVARAVMEPLADAPTWTGLVQSERKARLGAEVPGRIVERTVERGSRVRQGDVLLVLDDTRIALEAERARVAVQAAEHQATYAASELERATSLGDSLPAQALDQARHADLMARDGLAQARIAEQAAERALRDTRLRAPWDGVVAERFADVGDAVALGVPVFLLVSVDPILVRVGVSAAEASRMAPGDRADVVVADTGGASSEAELQAVGQVPDPITGTWPADFRLGNPSGDLREGMVATVRARAGPEPVVQVPREAVVDHLGAPAVFVVAGGPDGERASLRRVRLGRHAAGTVEVVEGLGEGEEAVIEGQFALVDGARVEVERADAR